MVQGGLYLQENRRFKEACISKKIDLPVINQEVFSGFSDV